MKRYPEHEKLAKVSESSQAIGDFIAWLPQSKQSLRLAYWVGQELRAWSGDITELLAEYFGIDRAEIERERREMLNEILIQQEKMK